MSISSLRAVAIAAVLLLGACDRASATPADAAPPATSASAEAKLRLTPAAIADAQIVTGKVTRQVLRPAVALTGEIAADPDRSAIVSSPLPGRIQSVAFKEGDRVAKGATVVRIAVTEIGKLRAAHAAAVAHAKASRADANRLRGLVAKALRPEQDLLDAEAAAEAHEAEARGIAAQLTAIGFAASAGSVPSSLALVSPIDGVVITRSAIVGAPVIPHQDLGHVVDLAAPWFLGRVFEKDLARVRVGAKATVIVNAFPKDSFEGVVEALGAQVDPTTRTVMVRVRVTNRDDLLRIGLWGNAHVATDEAPAGPVLVVPRTAVIDVAGRKVAFVRVGDAFEPREVSLGASSVDLVEILAGLAIDEEVVVAGAFTLKSVMLRSTLAED